MRIEKIGSVNYQKPNRQNFKGYVNNTYYADYIIDAAKKALKDPYWESNMRKKLVSTKKALSSWHQDNEMEGSAFTRVITAIATCGISEVYYGSESIKDAKENNRKIENDIKEIKSCMKNLLGGH